MKELTKKYHDVAWRQQETDKLASRLQTCLAQTTDAVLAAGKVVRELVDEVWNGDEVKAWQALGKTVTLDQRIFTRLLGFGRGHLIPELASAAFPALTYIEQMPVEEQVRLLRKEEPIDVITLDPVTGDPLPPERKKVRDLKAVEAARVFVRKQNKIVLRTPAQLVAVAKADREKQQHRYAAQKTWYKPWADGKRIKVLANRVVSRGQLAELLLKLVQENRKTEITPEEKSLAQAILA
jgi:hypothetical protein